MSRFLRRTSVYFSAGAFGGLVNALAVWFFGNLGVTAAFGVAISPTLSPAMVYHRVVWGGIWGLVFLIPIALRSPAARAVFFSLGPTFAQLFIVFPGKAHKGMMGLELGTLTPLFVFLFNLLWAAAALAWLRIIKES